MPFSASTTTKPFSIPWKCLDDSDPPKIGPQLITKNKSIAKKSFAQVLANVCDTPFSQLPKPTRKGDKFSISIPDDEYDIGLNGCKNNLHGRVIWPKGTSPLTVVALREKLKPVWKELGPWGVTSIGKGYYEFIFSSIEDARRVRSVSSWILNPGYLKLFPWTPDFSPNLQSNSSAQVWLKIHGLAHEYWRKRIIFAIASSVGTPICVDSVTSKPAIERTFGHFARVLVDIDLAQDLKFEVLVERKGYAFFVEFEYENLPDFCDYCKTIGHSAGVCRKRKAETDKQQYAHMNQKNDAARGKVAVQQQADANQQQKTWTPKEKEVVDLDIDEGPLVNAAAVPKPPVRSTTDVELENDMNIDQGKALPVQNETLPVPHIDQKAEREGICATYSGDDINSNDCSEFVEETQQNFEDESTCNTEDRQRMNVVQKDWANQAELEEGEATPAAKVTSARNMSQGPKPKLAYFAGTKNYNFFLQGPKPKLAYFAGTNAVF